MLLLTKNDLQNTKCWMTYYNSVYLILYSLLLNHWVIISSIFQRIDLIIITTEFEENKFLVKKTYHNSQLKFSILGRILHSIVRVFFILEENMSPETYSHSAFRTQLFHSAAASLVQSVGIINTWFWLDPKCKS